MANVRASRAQPASTGWLIISIIFANKLWILDATSLSLYWVARLPIARAPYRSPLALRDKAERAPTAHNRNKRPQKIALSLAIVGAIAAPFAYGTYKARPTYSVWVPLTAQEKENLAFHLQRDEFCVKDSGNLNRDIVCRLNRDTFYRGGRNEYHPDLLKYLTVNVGVAAGTFVSVFAFALLIPMLVRGFASLVRRYWKWLNA